MFPLGVVVEAVDEMVKGGSWGDVVCCEGFVERGGEVEFVSWEADVVLVGIFGGRER